MPLSKMNETKPSAAPRIDVELQLQFFHFELRAIGGLVRGSPSSLMAKSLGPAPFHLQGHLGATPRRGRRRKSLRELLGVMWPEAHGWCGYT